MKRLIPILVLFLMFIVLPLGSYLYLSKGVDYRLAALEMVKPKGQLIDFEYYIDGGLQSSRSLNNKTALIFAYYNCEYERMKILIKYGSSVKGWEDWEIFKNRKEEDVEKSKDIMNNYKIYLPLWNIRNHYLYPKEWNIKCVNYLLLFKKINNNNNNINIPKDIKYMLLQYIYEIWKCN